jgi:hypothetical protein
MVAKPIHEPAKRADGVGGPRSTAEADEIERAWRQLRRVRLGHDELGRDALKRMP